MSRLSAKSDSQANAEALARRSTTYADEHAASWQVRFDRRGNEPTGLGGYVKELRAAYADEMPERSSRHGVWSDHEDGMGSLLGSPAESAAMEALMYGPTGAVGKDGYITGPFRTALASIAVDHPERARIVYRIVNGMAATEAAIAEGVPAWCAKIVATEALRITWRNISSVPLPTRTAAA